MKTTFKLILLFSSIISLAGLTLASTVGDRVNLAEFANRPEALSGRTIEVKANIVAVNADGKSLELFDSQSHTRIDVRLTQLRKADRVALVQSGARRVSVSGRASVVAGRLTIDALSIQPAPLNEEARVEPVEKDEAPEIAIVPIAVYE